MKASTIATTSAAGGTTVVYEVIGDGPAVVLVHGLTESRRSWDPLVERLAADHTVVALDLPGHGESDLSAAYDVGALVDAVHAVVDATELVRPLLVGHSLGGWVVTAAAGAVSCRGVINVDQRLELSASRSALAPLEPALRGDAASFRRVISDNLESAWGSLSEPERARVRSCRQARQDVVLAIWAPLFESSPAELEALSRRVASDVTMPYLSLHGEDPGAGYGRWLTEVIPDATVEVWPGAGHYPHLVEPARFVARLRAFEEST